MTTTRIATTHSLALIEVKRFARHPLFIVGALLTLGLTAVMGTRNEPGDLLSWPVVPAFFTGVSSIIVAARLTRSAERADEALDAAPYTEADRTRALLAASVVPFAVGLLWMIELLVLTAVNPPHPVEWWFGTTSDLYVLGVLVGNGVVACLGGALLGVLVGRWLHFPGAPALVAVGIVVGAMAMNGVSETAYSQFRLWTPWVSWHSGTQEEDGTATIFAGSPAWSAVYLLCLCAAAALVALWHDRSARTPQLRRAIAGVTVVGVVALGLSASLGLDENLVSPPNPNKLAKTATK
jgi:hypothetical protein